MTLSQRILAAAVLAVGALTAATPAMADRITLLLGSHHAGARSGQFEEFNPGVFYTWEGAWAGLNGGLSLGGYRNSYGKLSVASAASVRLFNWDSGDFGAFAGIAHYPDDGARFASHLGGDIVGLAGLQLRQGNFLIQALPMDQGAADGLFTFGLTFDLGE
jgi:hypothetical protein